MKWMMLSAVFLLFLSSCEKNSVKNNDQVRDLFSGQLKPLLPPNYNKILGNTPSAEELELGRLLFSDPILSRNNDVSCATCHLSNHGFGDGNGLIVGALGQGGPDGNTVGKEFGQGVLSTERSTGNDGLGFEVASFMFRNTLSTINVAYRAQESNEEGLFHDGRFGNIFFQSFLPIHTPIEMCGKNPVPLPPHKNLFEEGGPIFRKPVIVRHSHSWDRVQGLNLNSFNDLPEEIKGIPTRRKTNSISIPVRNECLAIAVAKVRLIKEYRKRFREVYKKDEIKDYMISRALGSYTMSHVSINTPYDRFVKGDASLTNSQLRGLASFFTPMGKEIEILGKKIKGAGCNHCHSAPTFGGKGFANLGVRSDRRSQLTQPSNVVDASDGFFEKPYKQRGYKPNCEVKGVTVDNKSTYTPDRGRANGSFDDDDCFKFRVPPLRNVIETFPFFHHGTERAIGLQIENLEDRSVAALKKVVRYHLRGPQDAKNFYLGEIVKGYFDDLYQKDLFVPAIRQNFYSLTQDRGIEHFPLKLKDSTVDDIVNFIAYGLWDKNSVKMGALGNDVSHPQKVPSGFYPTITRDHGTQLELPPNRDR